MNDGKRTAIIGKSGYGKSYFVKKKIIPALVKSKPVFIIDPKPDYFGPAARDANPKWKGFFNWPDLANKILDDKKIKKEVYILRPRNGPEFTAAVKFILAFKKPIYLIIEEGRVLKLSSYKTAYEEVMKVARMGRSDGIDLILVSQRLKDFPPDIRTQIDGIVSFYQDHPDDVKEIQQIDYKAGSKVNALKSREYVFTDDLPEGIKKII